MPDTFAYPWLLLLPPVALLAIGLLAISDPRARPRYCRVGLPVVRLVLIVALSLVVAGPRRRVPPPAGAPPPPPPSRLVAASFAYVALPEGTPSRWREFWRAGLRRDLRAIAAAEPLAGVAWRTGPRLVSVARARLPLGSVDAGQAKPAAARNSAPHAPIAPGALPGEHPAELPWPFDATRTANGAPAAPDSVVNVTAGAAASEAPLFPSGLAWLAADAAALARAVPDPAIRRLHVFGLRLPGRAQTAALKRLGFAWRFHRLAPPPAPQHVSLSAITVEPEAPEADLPFSVYASVRVARAADWRWSLVVDGVALVSEAPLPAPERDGIARLVSPAIVRPAGVRAVVVRVSPAPAPDVPDAPEGRAAERRRGVVVAPHPRFQVLGAAPTEASFLMASAAGAQIELQPVGALDSEQLYEFDGAVLALSELLKLDALDLEDLGGWVREGGSLIVTADGSARADSYALRRVRDLLPVRFTARPPQTSDAPPERARPRTELQEVAATTVLVMLDNSGSMAKMIGGSTRSAFMREAIKALIDTMNAEDRLGVYYFDKVARRWIAPQAIGKQRAALKRKVDRMPLPGGYTSIADACRVARQVLSRETSAVRHLVLLSDGAESVDRLHNFRDDGNEFARLGISVSVIGVGDADRRTLLMLPTKGGTYSFLRERRDAYVEVPQLFIREYRLARKRGLALQKQDSRPKPPDSDNPGMSLKRGAFAVTPASGVRFLDRLGGAALPNVRQYVPAEAWPGALTLLRVGPAGAPLLVSWRRGFGEVAVLTTSFTREALPDWRTWPKMPLLIGGWWRSTLSGQTGHFRLRGARLRRARGGTGYVFEARLDRPTDRDIPWARFSMPLLGGASLTLPGVPAEGESRLEAVLIAPYATRQENVSPADAERTLGAPGVLPARNPGARPASPPADRVLPLLRTGESALAVAIGAQAARDYAGLELRIRTPGAAPTVIARLALPQATADPPGRVSWQRTAAPQAGPLSGEAPSAAATPRAPAASAPPRERWAEATTFRLLLLLLVALLLPAEVFLRR